METKKRKRQISNLHVPVLHEGEGGCVFKKKKQNKIREAINFSADKEVVVGGTHVGSSSSSPLSFSSSKLELPLSVSTSREETLLLSSLGRKSGTNIPLSNREKKIFEILSTFIIIDCLSIVLGYSQIINLSDLMLLVKKKKEWMFSLGNTLHLRPYEDRLKYLHFKEKFSPTLISSEEWDQNLVLYELIFAINIRDTFRIEELLRILTLNETKIQHQEQQQLEEDADNCSLFSSSSSFLDLISFFILIAESEFEWCTTAETTKNHRDTWKSFVLWILLYLLNPEATKSKELVVHNRLISSAFYSMKTESIYSLFFNSDYKSNIPNICTEELIKTLVIGNNVDSYPLGGESISRFVHCRFSSLDFRKCRLKACLIHKKAHLLVSNLLS